MVNRFTNGNNAPVAKVNQLTNGNYCAPSAVNRFTNPNQAPARGVNQFTTRSDPTQFTGKPVTYPLQQKAWFSIDSPRKII